VTDAALLEQQTSDNVIGEGLEIAAANEIDVEHNETTEPQETSEKVNEIDLAFTNFVAPF
jgi:hypothetical protein